MSWPLIKIALRRHAIFRAALAYLLVLNGFFAGLGPATSSITLAGSQDSPFAGIICAAAAAAVSEIAGDHQAPGPGHAHQSHHCVLCCASGHAALAGDPVVIPMTILPPERPSGVARPVARYNAPPLSCTGFMTSRSARAPPLTV
ncbi:MAG: DUF2946 family protein [Beijerinckiaceae bacterium]|nr:DUF2946 family protein [Beijerinckiaceae bacterium]